MDSSALSVNLDHPISSTLCDEYIVYSSEPLTSLSKLETEDLITSRDEASSPESNASSSDQTQSSDDSQNVFSDISSFEAEPVSSSPPTPEEDEEHFFDPIAFWGWLRVVGRMHDPDFEPYFMIDYKKWQQFNKSTFNPFAEDGPTDSGAPVEPSYRWEEVYGRSWEKPAGYRVPPSWVLAGNKAELKSGPSRRVDIPILGHSGLHQGLSGVVEGVQGN